jgi:hypothetical protein
MIPFHLDWPVCVDGYRIEDPKKATPAGATFSIGPKGGEWRAPKQRKQERTGSLLLTGDVGARIVRNSDKFEMRQPLIDTSRNEPRHGLCRRLADCPATHEGVLEFVNTYGFLFKPKAPHGEHLDEIFRAIDSARMFVARVKAKDWHRLAAILDNWGQDRMFLTGGVGRLGVKFAVDPGASRPTLLLQPADLYNAALVQLLDEATSGRPLKKCIRPGCPEYFTYGPGTPKRETAIYCSPKCQKAHEYMRRKESQS